MNRPEPDSVREVSVEADRTATLPTREAARTSKGPDPADRLYGLPGAEYLDTDPSSVYETHIEPYDAPGPDTKVEIEEWSVHPPLYHLPSAPALIEWLEDWVAENGEISEDFEVHFDSPGVRWAADTLLKAAAQQITWRMANEKLASHWVTWDEFGPLLDGEPMYQPAPTPAPADDERPDPDGAWEGWCRTDDRADHG